MSETRISSLLGKITVLVVICCCCLPAQAKYGGGSGTAEDPYQIWDPNHMQAIGADPCDWGSHFKLMADIDLSSYTGTSFNIIGYVGSGHPYEPNNKPFNGVFDGNDHTISNLTYTYTDIEYIGIFGYIDDPNAEIKNLGLIDPNVDGYHFGTEGVGSLVGYLREGTISNCYAEGGSVEGEWSVGGLVGLNYGSISNCYSTGSVSGDHHVGGLVGYNWDGGSISNCYSTGSVSGDYGVGGLVGRNRGGSVLNCYSTGDVSNFLRVGGLVGDNWFGGSISNCYSTGDVSGEEVLGGLVGFNWGSSVSNCYSTGSVSDVNVLGGLVGFNYGSISNCYSTGDVSGEDDVGGLVGLNWYVVLNCFWDTDTQTHGVTESIGDNDGTVTNVAGLPTAQMQIKSTFTDTDWDFIGIWNIGENQTYPYLRVYLAGDINKDGIVNFLDIAITANQWIQEQ